VLTDGWTDGHTHTKVKTVYLPGSLRSLGGYNNSVFNSGNNKSNWYRQNNKKVQRAQHNSCLINTVCYMLYPVTVDTDSCCMLA